MANQSPPQTLQSPPPGGPAAAALLAAVSLPLGAASFFTQRLARRLAFDPVLGGAWIVPELSPALLEALAVVLVTVPLAALPLPATRPAAAALALPAAACFGLAQGPLYPPLAGWRWAGALVAVPEGRSLLVAPAVEATALLVTSLVLTLALYRTAVGRGTRRLAEVAHGTARYADWSDLRGADLLSGEGAVLGSVRRHGLRQPLTDRSSDHILLLMPPGGGKTSGPIAGTLLNSLEPTVVLDPKGELWQLTAGWRASMGHRVLRFAPHAGAAASRWNPLDEIPRGPGEVAAIAALADNLVSHPAERTGESHWTASARSLLRCLVLHELYTNPQASLPTVRSLLHEGLGGGAEELFWTLASADHDPRRERGWIDAASGESMSTHPEVRRLATAFAATPERELGSIISTLGRHLDLWGDERIAAASASSSWRLDLVASRQPATLYVTVPFQQLARIAPLVRVLVALLVHQVTADDGAFRDHQAASGRRRLLLVLDEFASLGRIPMLEEVLAFLRGYGVRACLAVQDLGQLHRLYGPHESISGTCQLHLASATANTRTRSEISRRLGEATLVYAKTSRSGGGFKRSSTTRSQIEVRRPLLTEGEVGMLPADRLLVSKGGCPPILAEKLPYFTDAELARRAAIPPPEVVGEPPTLAEVAVGEAFLPAPPPPPRPLARALRRRDAGEREDLWL